MTGGMEVAVPMPVPTGEFNFDSACTTPYASAPSSPRPFDSSARYFYTSAPTSPSRAAAIYAQFRAAASVAPFDWEEKPATPNPLHQQHADEDDADSVDFAFEFSGPIVGTDDVFTATADELFEAGRIRAITPLPSRLIEAGVAGNETAFSPRSPKAEAAARSPRQRSKSTNPFERSALQQPPRGRDRGAFSASASGRSGSRRSTRSLSPLRGGFDLGDKSPATATDANACDSPATGSRGLTKGSSKKWRLRDFFLFRSASEGRASGARAADPLRKYAPISPAAATLLSRRMEAEADAKCASFRSVDEGSSHGGSRRGAIRPSGSRVANASNDGSTGRSSRMRVAPPEEVRRRKTLLPYKQGLFGFFGFHPDADVLRK